MAHGSRRMQTHLAALASRREPPLGFFRGFVVERGGDYADTLNVKRGGTAAIVQLARLYSLKVGDTVVGTRERLQQAAGVATAEESAQNLIDAFDYVTGLSLQHQARQLRSGEVPDYHIAPSALSTMSRENLRDAFNIIKKAQGAVATTYPVRSV
jgi:CBS domain-containing protein